MAAPVTCERTADSTRTDAVAMAKARRRLSPLPTLAEARARAAQDLERLPEDLRRLTPGTSYPVEVAAPLMRLADEVDRRLERR